MHAGVVCFASAIAQVRLVIIIYVNYFRGLLRAHVDRIERSFSPVEHVTKLNWHDVPTRSVSKLFLYTSVSLEQQRK
jgi:hypothetical protein